MRTNSDLQPFLAVALALWVTLVPALTLQTQRADGYVVLPIEMTCDMEASVCAKASGACPMPESSEPARTTSRPMPRCCICIRTGDLTMEVSPDVTLVAVEPIVRAAGTATAMAVSRTVQPPVPPPKLG